MDELTHVKGKETTPFFIAKIKEGSTITEPVYTFIGASTLPDRAGELLPDGSRTKGEILSKNVLDKIAGLINDTTRMGGDYGSYRTISLFHDRVYEKDYTKEEAGYVLPTARVLEMPDYPGNYALHVDTKINKMYNPNPKYADYTPEKIRYKIENGAVGLSLEYNNSPTQERIVNLNGDTYKYILDTNDFRGFGFARPDLIGNTSAVRIKESMFNSITLSDTDNKKVTGELMDEAKMKQMETDIALANTKLKEATDKVATLEAANSKTKEMHDTLTAMDAKLKEMKMTQDAEATKLKESFSALTQNISATTPGKATDNKTSKVKEVYAHAEALDFVKFKEAASEHLEQNGLKIKELMARDGSGFDFEKYQTLTVMPKAKGDGRMIVVPSTKTKDVIGSSNMDEAALYQANQMFADTYVAGITETFLKEDSLLTAISKETFLGGNDRYQWRVWVDYQTVSSTTTLAVDPNNTSVNRTKREFLKLEQPICEYRDGVEVTDFTQYHSMRAVGDLLGIELQRAAQAVTESMNSDMFKGKSIGVSSWNGLTGLLYYADSSTYTSLYGRTRSATTNRLADATIGNTYITTSESISVQVVRSGYEKVLAHGARLADIAIVMHPTQCRKLFDSEDAAIRNNIMTMAGAPATFGFSRSIIPYLDGIPIIRDYRCESSSAAADMFAVVDMSADKGLNLIVSKPLGARGLAKIGTSESAYVSCWANTVYKNVLNIFVHTSLTTT